MPFLSFLFSVSASVYKIEYFRLNAERVCTFRISLSRNCCIQLPEPNSIFGYDMRLKIVQMGHMESEKKLSHGVPTSHQLRNVS